MIFYLWVQIWRKQSVLNKETAKLISSIYLNLNIREKLLVEEDPQRFLSIIIKNLKEASA